MSHSLLAGTASSKDISLFKSLYKHPIPFLGTLLLWAIHTELWPAVNVLRLQSAPQPLAIVALSQWVTLLFCGRQQLEVMRLKNERLEAATRKKKTEKTQNKSTASTTHKGTKAGDRKVPQCQHCPWALQVSDMALEAIGAPMEQKFQI